MHFLKKMQNGQTSDMIESTSGEIFQKDIERYL